MSNDGASVPDRGSRASTEPHSVSAVPASIPSRGRHRHSDDPVYPVCRPAIDVLREAANLTQHDARAALRALVKAGYVVAPREPTNSMLDAYMHALRSQPSTTRSCILNVAKARKRWLAMGGAGTQVAMSTLRLNGGGIT